MRISEDILQYVTHFDVVANYSDYRIILHCKKKTKWGRVKKWVQTIHYEYTLLCEDPNNKLKPTHSRVGNEFYRDIRFIEDYIKHGYSAYNWRSLELESEKSE